MIHKFCKLVSVERLSMDTRHPCILCKEPATRMVTGREERDDKDVFMRVCEKHLDTALECKWGRV